MKAPSGLFSSALAGVRKCARLWFLQAGGIVALAVLGYGWLYIPEARAWQVGISALAALALVALATLLHAGTILTLHWGRTTGEGSREKFRSYNFRQLIAVGLLCATLLVVACWMVRSVEENDEIIGDWISSWLTMKLQKPVSHAATYVFADHVWWFAAWGFIVVLWLPMAVALTCRGLGGAGWRAALRGWFAPRYWGTSLLVTFFGGFLPWQLANWRPELKGLWIEAASLALRLGIAYAIGVTAWMLLLALAEKSVNRDLPDANGSEKVAEPTPVTVPSTGGGAHSAPPA
ncbi:MAG TPA: hypothetical protein VNL38_03535 [Candidatus Nitrosotenuis sp.]|nr:hypothetical protein [Candidatus Nitrosotenuis sp.]